MDTVPVVVADDLTPEQVKAYRLADNKTAEFAEWDADLLDMELDDLDDIDMSLFGFELSDGGGRKKTHIRGRYKSRNMKCRAKMSRLMIFAMTGSNRNWSRKSFRLLESLTKKGSFS
jgi:hypothetical protein